MKYEMSTQRIPRRWFPLWILDRYILREFLIKYSILMLVFAILFVLNDVYYYIADFLNGHAPFKEVTLFFLYKLPGNIRFVLPISMLLGCMWTMAAFGKNLEITAMRASGVSVSRSGAMILLVGLLVTAVNILFNEKLVPLTERKAEILFDEVADHRRFAHSLLAYRSNDLKRHWLFKTFTGSGDQDSVTIKTFWNEEMIRKIVGTPSDPRFAEKVKAVFPAKAEELLSVSDPDILQEKIIRELKDRKIDFFVKSTFYDNKEREWHFRNGTFVSYDRSDETMFSGSRGTSEMHPEIPFEELVFPDSEIPETPFDILNSIREKDDLPTISIWRLLQNNPDMSEKARNIYLTIFFYRLAFPWSCFLSVFLGVPLATRNERTGSMLAIITAIGVIVGYMVIAQIFLVLGKGGHLNPCFAGLAPTLAFIAYGAKGMFSDRT
ncbi:MAG: LptF/LptG family permease [Victivallaceae bacterium]|nr:LptF/LptG family permease [Victivallaceae bacterium]